MFAAQSEAKVTNLLIALANTKKLQMTTSEFLSKMQGLADELIAAGHPLLDKQLVSYILAGLGSDYNALVAALGVVTTPISLAQLYSHIYAYDQRQLMLQGPPAPEFETSANAASRQWRPRSATEGNYGRNRGDRGDRGDRRDERRDWRRDDRNQGRGGGRGGPAGGRGRGRGRRRTTPWVDATCQICNKEGHYAKDCWSRYSNDDDYGDKEVHAAYGVDTNWYQDTGATHHITGELNNLTMRDAYKGHDKVDTANGQGMGISHIGHSIIRSPSKKFELRNVLHVPNASKNLLSVHRFTYDNHVFIEFHPFFFLIKD
jgi:histone deacetylase 1/2